MKRLARAMFLAVACIACMVGCVPEADAQAAAFHYGFETKKISLVAVSPVRAVTNDAGAKLIEFAMFAGAVPASQPDFLAGASASFVRRMGRDFELFAGGAVQFQENQSPFQFGAILGGRFTTAPNQELTMTMAPTPRGVAFGLMHTRRF